MIRSFNRRFESEWKCLRKRKVLSVLLVIYIFIVLFQLRFSGMWMMGEGRGGFTGFFPDPSIQFSAEDLSLLGGKGSAYGLLFNVVPVAHALFFPFIAVLAIPWFCESSFIDRVWEISKARGAGEGCVLVVRSLISTSLLLGVYILCSAALLILMFLLLPATGEYFDAGLFFQRLLLSCLVCASITCSYVIAASFFGKGFGALGIMLLINVVGLIMQLMTNRMLLVPSSMLMWTCGVVPIGQNESAAIVGFCALDVLLVFCGCSVMADIRSKYIN